MKRNVNDFFKAEDFGGLSREFWFPQILEIANDIIKQWAEEKNIKPEVEEELPLHDPFYA